MKHNSIKEALNKVGLDKEHVISTLREVEYKYTQYIINESIEEIANVHPKTPDELHCIHSVIKLFED